VYPSASSARLVWVDLHLSKNCPGNPGSSNGVCPAPFSQPPFDLPYALNLHNSATGSGSSSGATLTSNGVFSFTVDATPLQLTANDQLCYDFTYTFGANACDTGICSLGGTSAPATPTPSTAATTAPTTASTSAPTTTSAPTQPPTGAIIVTPAPTGQQCSTLQYTQSVSVSGNTVSATFTPAAGQQKPDWVDFHISKNCPGSPGSSNGVCPVAWNQPPFDEPYALNVHASGIGQYSTVGASYSGGSFLFSFDFTTAGLTSSDALCYDFTFAFGNVGCDTGICGLSSGSPTPSTGPTTTSGTGATPTPSSTTPSSGTSPTPSSSGFQLTTPTPIGGLNMTGLNQTSNCTEITRLSNIRGLNYLITLEQFEVAFYNHFHLCSIAAISQKQDCQEMHGVF